MNWMDRIFSGAVRFDRVNPFGLGLMALGLLGVVLAKRIAREKEDKAIYVKLAGLLVCAAGAMLAILGK